MIVSPPPQISLADLSERDLLILRLLTAGKTNKEIAQQTGFTKNVVDKVLSNSTSYSLYRKLGVDNAKQAVAWYMRHGSQDAVASTVSGQPVPRVIPPATRYRTMYLAVLVSVYLCLILLDFVPVLVGRANAWMLAYYGTVFAIIPALGGGYGLWAARQSREQSNGQEMRGYAFFAAGLLLWAVGALASVPYLLRSGNLPYPAWPDLFYFGQTLCQATAFLIWWRTSYLRGAQRYWPMPAITVALFVPYFVVPFFIREANGTATVDHLLFVLDFGYALLDSLSLACALTLLLPRAMRVLSASLRQAAHFRAIGMGLMFLAGAAYVLTDALPATHPLAFAPGHWVDWLFATAFLFMSIALGRIP